MSESKFDSMDRAEPKPPSEIKPLGPDVKETGTKEESTQTQPSAPKPDECCFDRDVRWDELVDHMLRPSDENIISRMVVRVGNQIADLLGCVTEMAKSELIKKNKPMTQDEREHENFMRVVSGRRNALDHLFPMTVTWWLDNSSTPVSEAYSVPIGATLKQLQLNLVQDSRFLRTKGSLFKTAADHLPVFDWSGVDIVSFDRPRIVLMPNVWLRPIDHAHLVIRPANSNSSHELFRLLRDLDSK